MTLGITGRSVCGKSTVTAVFAARGIPLADADQLSREILLPDSPLLPQLAERFTVVATDLRGYGDSGKPEGLPDHSNYSKRTMAEDQIEVMRALGFERFHVMGHDRGARVAYRMALDHPEAVNKLVLLDIVSTYDMYSLSTREFAKALFQ